MTTTAVRDATVQRGIRLGYATILYNSFEAIGSLVAGILAGSVALVGFGADSVIEVIAAGAAQWRLRSEAKLERRAMVELASHRIVGLSFLALAVYITVDSASALWHKDPPEKSFFGIFVLSLSIVVMPLLASAKTRVARGIGSNALRAEARQTSLCAWLSLIALVGVALNALLGWWWADPLAALGMVPIIVKEGIEGVRASPDAVDCC
ncbi:MAG TPA: cation transporter [Gemmatimonadaceae bacterium]|nr:cation transporter [Gemmatimonadaceae bacterium]